MDRGAWWATAREILRVGHDLALSFFVSKTLTSKRSEGH